MTHYVSKIERLRVLDGESSFGTDGSGSMGSFLEVPFIEGTCNPVFEQPQETPGHAQQFLDGYPTRVHLPRRCTLPFSVNMEVPTTKATNAVAATKGWLGALLHTALGGYHQMTGTTVNGSGATTTVIPATVATTLRPGAAVGLNTGTSSALEIREIESKSGSDITLKLAASNAPSAAAAIIGSSTYYTDPYSTGANFRSLQFAFEGQGIEDRHLMRGSRLNSLGIELTPGGIPRFNFEWRLADWDQADGAATSGDLTGSVLGAATYINTNTLVLADSEFRVAVVASSSLGGTLIHASSFTYNPNIQYADVMTVAGVNNVLQGVRTHNGSVITGDFTVPYEDQTWFADRHLKTARALWLQIGSSTSIGGVLISIPNAQITDVQRVDVGGVSGQRVSWMARHDTDTTAESGEEEIAKSAFRIHVI